MSVWDDDEEKYDLSRKGKSDEPSDFDRAMMMKSSEDEPAGPSSEPSWAAAYKAAEADHAKNLLFNNQGKKKQFAAVSGREFGGHGRMQEEGEE